MNELAAYTKALLRITSSILALCMLGWILLPDIRSVMLGIFAGVSVSAFNSWHQAMRVSKFTQAAARGERTRGLGFSTRVAAAVIVVAAAAKLEQLDLYATLGSLFVAQIAFIVISFIMTARH